MDLALKLQDQITVEDLDKIVYFAKDGSQFLQSADKALQDLAKVAVYRACSQLLTKRDSWFRENPRNTQQGIAIQGTIKTLALPAETDIKCPTVRATSIAMAEGAEVISSYWRRKWGH